MNRWRCNYQHYRYMECGKEYYPEYVGESIIGFYIEQLNKRLWYSKENFTEIFNSYHPDQTGDTDEDI